MVHAVPRLEPVEKNLGLLGPEGFRMFDGLPIETLVIIVVQVRALAHGIGNWMASDLKHGGSFVVVCPRCR
ncbi:hypothetical protein D3C84_1027960 [compost metagenome]